MSVERRPIKNIIINDRGNTKDLYTTIGIFMGLNGQGLLRGVDTITYNGRVLSSSKVKGSLNDIIEELESGGDLYDVLELVRILFERCSD